MPDTRLTRTIALLYSYQESDIQALADDLLQQRKQAWRTALRDVGREHGVTLQPRAPSGADLRELRRLALEDARSIAKTFNRDARRQVERLYEQNRRGNRNFYAKNMERWANERGRWKNVQIALNTETSTRELARDAFYRNNGIVGGQYVFAGGVPTCKRCVRLFGLGIVSQAVRNRYGDSQHVGCPHYWQKVNPERLGNVGVWMG